MLKGDDTLVAAPDGRVAICPGARRRSPPPGTGDVLSGVIGAMLAKGMRPLTPPAPACCVHVRAGRLAAEPHGADGVIASDVIAALPARPGRTADDASRGR